MLIALAGTPLRLVEAGCDLAHLLADAGDLDTPDGGVGDDREASTLAAPATDAVPSPWADAPAWLVLPPPAASAATPDEFEGLRLRIWWPPDPGRPLTSWLQILRF